MILQFDADNLSTNELVNSNPIHQLVLFKRKARYDGFLFARLQNEPTKIETLKSYMKQSGIVQLPVHIVESLYFAERYINNEYPDLEKNLIYDMIQISFSEGYTDGYDFLPKLSII